MTLSIFFISPKVAQRMPHKLSKFSVRSAQRFGGHFRKIHGSGAPTSPPLARAKKRGRERHPTYLSCPRRYRKRTALRSFDLPTFLHNFYRVTAYFVSSEVRAPSPVLDAGVLLRSRRFPDHLKHFWLIRARLANWRTTSRSF